MFENYIGNLLENIPKPNYPYKLDIVLEGGAFAGFYGLGILLFIKELEKKQYITVNRLSGVSAGAMCCLKYVIGTLNDSTNQYLFFKKKLRENLNYSGIQTIINKDISEMSDETFQKIKANKLFITFYDMKLRKKIVRSVFADKEDLRTVIMKSSHLPYIMNGSCFIEDSSSCFCDGGFPFIFPERERTSTSRILYISHSHFSNLKNFIFIKNENTLYGRISEGILDAYQFFLRNNSTQFCSFVNQWSITDFIGLRLKNALFIILYYIVEIGLIIGRKTRPILDKSTLYNKMLPIFADIYRDIFLYNCF